MHVEHFKSSHEIWPANISIFQLCEVIIEAKRRMGEMGARNKRRNKPTLAGRLRMQSKRTVLEKEEKEESEKER